MRFRIATCLALLALPASLTACTESLSSWDILGWGEAANSAEPVTEGQMQPFITFEDIPSAPPLGYKSIDAEPEPLDTNAASTNPAPTPLPSQGAPKVQARGRETAEVPESTGADSENQAAAPLPERKPSPPANRAPEDPAAGALSEVEPTLVPVVVVSPPASKPRPQIYWKPF